MNDCNCDDKDAYHDHEGVATGTATRHAEITAAIATNDYTDEHRSTYAYDLALGYDFDYDCRKKNESCNSYNDDYDRSNHRKRDSAA